MEADPSDQNTSSHKQRRHSNPPGDAIARDNVSHYVPQRMGNKVLFALKSGQTLLVWALLALFIFLRHKEIVLNVDSKSIFGDTSRGAETHTVTLNCGTACLTAAILISSRVILEYIISYLTLHLVRTRNSGQETFLTIHSLSSHIATTFVFTFIFLWIVLCDYNVIITHETIVNLSFSQMTMVCLTATLMFGTLHFFSERIRHSFNDVTSLNRMLQCLYVELILKVIDMGNAREEVTRSYIKRKLDAILPNRGAGGGNALILSDQEVQNTHKKLILYEFYKDEYFRGQYTKKDLKDVEYLQKKIHKKLMKNTSYIFDGESAYMTRISYLFPNSAVFEAIQTHLGIDPNATLACSEIVALTLKTLNERTAINTNLGHRYSALMRTEMIVKLIILFFSVASFFVGLKIGKEGILGFASSFLGLAFMIQSSVTDVVNGLVFLFFIHPFDIGDRVFVNIDGEKQNLVVLETHTLYTVFERWDNVRLYVYNKNLYNEMIHNFKRCSGILDPQNIEISLDTDEAKIKRFKSEMDVFLQSRPSDYGSSCMLNYFMIENTNKIHMRVSLSIKESGQDYEKYLRLKSAVLECMIEKLRDLDIRYVYPVQRIKVKKMTAG
jgi:small-conductance mechanosensitive channel